MAEQNKHIESSWRVASSNRLLLINERFREMLLQPIVSRRYNNVLQQQQQLGKPCHAFTNGWFVQAMSVHNVRCTVLHRLMISTIV